MEAEHEHCCCCCCCCEGGALAGAAGRGAEPEVKAGLRRLNSGPIQLRRERHRRRMAQFVAAALLLLLCGTLAVFLVFRLEKPHGDAPDTPTPDLHSQQPSGLSEKMVQSDERAAKHPAAMLTRPRSKHLTNGVYLLWEDSSGEAFLQGGFSYLNGSLIVPRNGLYRVYLQTTYHVPNFPCPADPVLLRTKVLVFSDSYPQDLPRLSAVDTVPCNQPDQKISEWQKSLFTSGLLRLEAKDQLRVQSEHTHLMARNEEQLFFGAELVDG